MNTSDWIALAAAIAAFLALIPSFLQMVADRAARKARNNDSQPSEGQSILSATETKPTNTPPAEPKKLNALGRAILLTSMGVALGVVELVLFSAVATLFGVAVDVHTMPTNWLVAFYALLLVPGVFLTFALFNIVSVLD